jgi:hypothetical protein
MRTGSATPPHCADADGNSKQLLPCFFVSWFPAVPGRVDPGSVGLASGLRVGSRRWDGARRGSARPPGEGLHLRVA